MPFFQSDFLISSTNSLELLRWWMVLQVRGLTILVNTLGTLYVTEPLLDMSKWVFEVALLVYVNFSLTLMLTYLYWVGS